MTQEDYCSYEVAKLLKEKGFDVYTPTRYDYDGGFHSHGDYLIGNGDISAPTHQMAMKWLRDTYSISIEPYCYEYGWSCGFSQFPIGITIYTSQESKEYGTYEEAVEAALKYVLEKLI